MGNKTNIEWCDHTFNAWIGCTKVAAGCAHCYAEALTKRMGVHWGPRGTRRLTSHANWKLPLRWNRKAEREHHAWQGMIDGGHDEAYLVEQGFTKPTRPRVFCASLADVFEDWTDVIQDHRREDAAGHATMRDARKDLFRLIDATPYLDWLLLTKRPENIRTMTPPYSWHGCETGDCPHDTTAECATAAERSYRDNVWLGASFSTQADADRNVHELLKCRELSPVLFVSAEPLIEEIKLPVWIDDGDDLDDEERRDTGPWPKAGIGDDGAGIDWLIVGGESGPKARPCDVAWIRLLRDHCRAAGVPCFVKQLGASPIGEVGSAAFATDRKGGDPSEWPEDLRVREFPRVKRGE